MSPADKTALVRRIADELGFDRVGIAPARPIARVRYLHDWLAAGRAGSMQYLHRNSDLRSDPSRLFDGARSVIVVAMNYHQRPPPSPPDAALRGRVAMYAWGRDYHLVVKERLKQLAARLRDELDEPFRARPCVDTVPILERELAAAAGVGWIGKNTLVLNHELGSYLFLGELVTDLDLQPDEPITDHCGSCTRCLDACPTDAFPAPYEMDASKCISYLTIEHRGDIPPELGDKLGGWVFGCDICQQVCPYNRDAPPTEHFDIQPPAPQPLISDMLNWSEAEYQRTVAHSAMNRATLDMMQRNARLAKQPRHAKMGQSTRRMG